jgi:hypothetical protein
MQELIKCEELCERLKLKKQSIYNMIHRGEFIVNQHYFKPTNRILLFDWAAIKDWLRGSNVENNAPAKQTLQPPKPNQTRASKAHPLNRINI